MEAKKQIHDLLSRSADLECFEDRHELSGASSDLDVGALRKGLRDKLAQIEASPNKRVHHDDAIPTGIAELDDALGGGFLRGRMIELVGRKSSGMSSFAVNLAARFTSMGEEVAWVDSCDALDPQSLIEAHVNPRHLLWIRPDRRRLKHALKAADTILDGGGFGLVVVDVLDRFKRSSSVPSSVWMRLAKRLEHRNTTCVVLRHYAGISSSYYRLRFEGSRMCQTHIDVEKVKRKSVHTPSIPMAFALPGD